MEDKGENKTYAGDETSRARGYNNEQREALGIPDSYSDKPVLYVSSHRGFLEQEYPSHVEDFLKALNGENKQEDKEYAFVDLTKAGPEDVVTLLRSFVLRADPSKEGEWLPENTSKNEPLPGFITNVIYIPPANELPEPSHTFAIHPGNYESVLTKLKAFLEEKGTINKKLGPGDG